MSASATRQGAAAICPDHFIKWLEGCAKEAGRRTSRSVRVPRIVRPVPALDPVGLSGRTSGIVDDRGRRRGRQPVGRCQLGRAADRGRRAARWTVWRCASEIFRRHSPWRTPDGRLRRGPIFSHPWSGGLSRIGKDDDVVLVGTGLTMVDVVLDLHSRGHRGRITAVSARPGAKTVIVCSDRSVRWFMIASISGASWAWPPGRLPPRN